MKPRNEEIASSASIELPSEREAALSSSAIGALAELHDSGNPYVDVADEMPDICKQGSVEAASLSRKEKRKNVKKLKRKQNRQREAEEQRVEIEIKLADPVELQQMILQEEAETAALEKQKKDREIQERLWLEREQKAMEEAERKREENSRKEWDLIDPEEENGADFEEGPAEIIWQGNEIIVKKRRVKVQMKLPPTVKDQSKDRPISNPLPPQRVAFDAYKDMSLSITASQAPPVNDGFEQNINFGTEQDKTHCPFHYKTGACRFGVRCSRVHVYPEKSCTLLMKNMYTGPGLAWEHDEGLEYTDEEVAQHYEEFYEDVHCEFLKFGELINFKVCRNVSAHLRGNVYVHYQSQDAALAALNAMTGRYFAGKQIFCEFVAVTRWRVAICGEYMKAYHQSCSHGTACNFLHCFRNPGGEYDWADWDASPPLYWQEKMGNLFQYKVANRNHDDRDRKGGWRGYSRRRDDASKQQFIRDHASEDRPTRQHTRNGEDGRSRSQYRYKQRHEGRWSRGLMSEQSAGYHSGTDSRISNHSSEDSKVTGSHSLRSPDSMKETTRRCYDRERDWSTGSYLRDSVVQHRRKNRSASSSENSRDSYADDGHDAHDNKRRSSASSRNLKSGNHNDNRARSRGGDQDSSYSRQKRRKTATDARKQKYKDFETDRLDSEIDNRETSASKQTRRKERRKGSHNYPDDSRSSSSDDNGDYRRRKSRSSGGRKRRRKNVSDVSMSPGHSKP